MADNPSSIAASLSRMRAMLTKSQIRQVLLLIFAMLIGAFLEMLGVGAIPVFISLLVSTEGSRDLFAFLPVREWVQAYDLQTVVIYGALGLVGVFVVKNLYLTALLYNIGRVMRDVSTAISARLFKAYMRSPYLLHLQRNPAQSIRNLTSEMDQMRLLLNMVTLAARETIVMCLIFLALILADPLVSIGTMGILALSATVFYILVRKSMRRSGQILVEARGNQLQRVNQALGALKIARVLGHEPYLGDSFNHATASKENEVFFQKFLAMVPRLFLEVSAISAVLMIVLFSLALGRSPQDILPILALISVSIVRLVPVITMLTSALAQLQAGGAAISAISDDLKLFEQKDASQHGNDATGEGGGPFKVLEIRNVGFTFPETQSAVLGDISITVPAGKSIGIVGPSGSGKSTLVDVVMGLVDPTQGQVLVDGIDIHKNRGRLRQLYGYIPQDIYLLDDTIAQNIAFGIPQSEIDPEALKRCLGDAQLDDFIDTLPAGLDTKIGDRGTRLSGGQRQRLGIARALYHRPSILVLDEATSALDGETENAVLGAMQRLRGSTTMITIAHRMNTIKDCDRIYRIENGRVTQSGTYAEVIDGTAGNVG